LQDFHLIPTVSQGWRAEHPRGDIQAKSFRQRSSTVLGESGGGTVQAARRFQMGKATDHLKPKKSIVGV
jgi:hypothetical protein